MTFDDYWKQHGLATSPAAMGLAFREVAEKAWNAANSAENAKLREALKRIARRVPIMGSEGDYRSGQLHALEACSEVARIALKT